MPKTYMGYRDLVSAMRNASEAAMIAAWQAVPVSTAAEMNIGDLGINRSDVEQRVAEPSPGDPTGAQSQKTYPRILISRRSYLAGVSSTEYDHARPSQILVPLD